MDNVLLQHRAIDIAAIGVRHKDTFRIKEQLSLSGSKPNIDQLLWKEMRLCGVSARPAGGRMLIDGNLEVFVIYSGEGEETPVQWWEDVYKRQAYDLDAISFLLTLYRMAASLPNSAAA